MSVLSVIVNTTYVPIITEMLHISSADEDLAVRKITHACACARARTHTHTHRWRFPNFVQGKATLLCSRLNSCLDTPDDKELFHQLHSGLRAL